MDAGRLLRAARGRALRGAHALRRTRLATSALVQLNLRTDRTWALPIVMYAPTSRCNSRCASCDWWRTDGARDLRMDEVAALARELPALGTKVVVFTGGEPLVRDDVFALAGLFRAQGVRLHLLTSGLALERHAGSVAEHFESVTLSLDAHTPELYRAIRGVDGLHALERGVKRLRELRPSLPVRARATLQRRNFRYVGELIEKAEALGLAQLSFLAADVTSESFGRAPTGQKPASQGLLLDDNELAEFERAVEKAIRRHAAAFARGRVAESPDKLRRLPSYYAAHLGRGPFPEVACNAPWVSAVVESDGTVRPCFFQPAVGNVREGGLRAVLDGAMVRFRQGLDVARDPTCERCVCTLNLGPRTRVE